MTVYLLPLILHLSSGVFKVVASVEILSHNSEQ